MALVCKRMATLLMQPCTPAWEHVSLQRLWPQVESRQVRHWDVLLLPDRVGPLLRWWYRNVAGFGSVALPPRLLGYQGKQELVAPGDRVDNHDLHDLQLLPPLLGMLAANPGRLVRLDIGRCNDPWAPMPSQAVPLVAHCSSLRALALWQLPAQKGVLGDPPATDFVTDAALAAAVAQLPHLEALALGWFCEAYEYEFDDWPDYWVDTPNDEDPATMRLTLEAIAGCRRLRALRIDGGKRVTAQQLPPAWTALTALSSVHLQDCDIRGMPALEALKELTLQRPASHQRRPLYLSQQSALEALSAMRCHFVGQLPASLRRLVLVGSGAKLRAVELQAEMDHIAAALQGLSQLDHLALRSHWYPGGEVPSSVAAAIDSLAVLRSLHVAATFPAYLTAMPPLGCLSQLTSFGISGKFPEVPPQLAELARCRSIDLSWARFTSAGDADAELGRLLAAATAPSAGGGATECAVWVDHYGCCRTYGCGLRVVSSAGRQQPQPHEIMTNDDFRDQCEIGGDVIF